VLSPEEYRLALLGLADFEGHWETFEAAASMVVDGQAKAAAIRQRLIPIAVHLPCLMEEELDVLRLWMARHWFASQFYGGGDQAEQARGREKTDHADGAQLGEGA
jgi:hypothetical protein